MLNRRQLHRPRRRWGRGGEWLARLQGRGGTIILAAGLLLLPACLFLIPRYWVNRNSVRSLQQWAEPTLTYANRMIKHLGDPPAFADLCFGDEPSVMAELVKAPLLVAYQGVAGNELWLRRGGRLRLADPSQAGQRYARWLRSARASGSEVWNPPDTDHPDFLKEAACVLRQPLGYTISVWRRGSPEAETFLRQALGDAPGFRVGLARAKAEERVDLPPWEWIQPPSLQVDLPLGKTFNLADGIATDLLGEAWRLVIVGSETEEVRFANSLSWWRLQAYGACALLFLPMALGLYLLHRARRRERLERDRMASMAHSLKTPLGILMLRCDSIRLGRFEPQRAEMELARICEEVENLTTFIDQSLRGLRRPGSRLPPEPIARAWFQRLVADLSLAFEDEGRALEVTLLDASGFAHAPSLRTALITMLENALNYGAGPITLRTSSRKRWLRVEVGNEGAGLSAEQLANVGRPFMRFRNPGSEGFAREGQGLGLFLMAQVAEQEGWGLTFASAPGKGFQVALELPLA